jgi:hypothetical protein
MALLDLLLDGQIGTDRVGVESCNQRHALPQLCGALRLAKEIRGIPLSTG